MSTRKFLLSLTSSIVDVHAPTADDKYAQLRSAAESVVIARCMGWPLCSVIDDLDTALEGLK